MHTEEGSNDFVRRNVGHGHCSTHNRDSEDVVIDDDRGLEEEWTSNGQTLWDINQIVATMPVDMNSAKKETVIELLDSFV